MAQQSLLVTVEANGVARLTLNRPELRNTLDEILIHDLCEAMGRLITDTEVRIIVVTGAGSAFCGGLDLNMMRRLAAHSTSKNKDDARRFAHMLNTIYTSPKPTIALVNGPAIGGGVGIIAACDIAISIEDAFFALREVRVGLAPAVISPFVIEAIGERQARRYFISGEKITCLDAKLIGLVHALAPATEFESCYQQIISELLLCGPEAQRETKEIIRSVAGHPITESILKGAASRIARLRASKEAVEGVNAYLEKRDPSWIRK